MLLLDDVVFILNGYAADHPIDPAECRHLVSARVVHEWLTPDVLGDPECIFAVARDTKNDIFFRETGGENCQCCDVPVVGGISAKSFLDGSIGLSDLGACGAWWLWSSRSQPPYSSFRN